jgi:hypothetical protein
MIYNDSIFTERMNEMNEIKHVIQVMSGCYCFGCEICNDSVRGTNDEGNLSKAINHYIVEHGYKLLHIGQYTSDDQDGNPWQGTTVLLGSDTIPSPKPNPSPEVVLMTSEDPSINIDEFVPLDD